MKINYNSKYVLYIILFIIFILIRINHVLLSGEIEELSFKSLAISRCFYPFEILKETALSDTFLPAYYFIIGILRNEIVIKVFNSILAFLNIYFLVIIGKKLLCEKLGLFLGAFLAINSFYLYYSGLISPWVLIILFQTLVINALIDYFKKPNKKTFNALNFFNCALILVDSFGFLFVISELILLHFIGKKDKIHSFYKTRFLNYSFIAFLVVLPILIIQYGISARYVISNFHDGIGLNISSLFLMLSEYTSPFLSFISPENQTKSILGFIYSFYMNPELNNINSLKILITLFYSSILPLIIIISMSIKAILENKNLKYIYYISLINLGFILILMLFEKIDTNPIYISNFFLTSLICCGYGIFSLKDNFIKSILIICLLIIQLINPDVNSFDITIKKNYAVLNPINIFIKENSISKEDLLIMPKCGKFGFFYFRKITNVFNYDDSHLQISKKNGILRNIISKKAKRISRKNINYLAHSYLLENKANSYISKYFIENAFNDKIETPKRFILIIDKLNSKPISQNSIIKFSSKHNYSPNLRKIDFRYADLNQSDSTKLLDALKSKTLYNFANILNTNFKLSKIVEYKKLENEYYKIPPSSNIYKAMTSFDSDYAFLIFE